MMRPQTHSLLAAGFTLGMLGVSASEFASDPTVLQYYPGSDLRLPVRVREKTFGPAERKANFTYFDGVEKVEDADGLLPFAMTGEKATLGWGNYAGQQKPDDLQNMFPGAH